MPKKLRAKLTLRWKIGIFLGYVDGSNEQYIGAPDGSVLKTRSIVRVVEGERWSASAIMNIKGIPGKHQPVRSEDVADQVERSDDPHANMEEIDRENIDGDPLVDDKGDNEFSEEAVQTMDRQIRITQRDLKLFGYTHNCPRCEALQRGNPKSKKHHNLECRLRMYLSYKETNDQKWRSVRH